MKCIWSTAELHQWCWFAFAARDLNPDGNFTETYFRRGRSADHISDLVERGVLMRGRASPRKARRGDRAVWPPRSFWACAFVSSTSSRQHTADSRLIVSCRRSFC